MPITDREKSEVDAANLSGKQPVAFIHGLWLLPNSWDRWASLFEEAGYAPVTPTWPDDPETVDAIAPRMESWKNITLNLRGESVEIDGVGSLTNPVVGA